MAAKRDYYQILGIEDPANCDDETVRQAFRKLVKELHPDVYSGDDAEKRMAEVNEAYNALRYEERRKQYESERSGSRRRSGRPQSQVVAWTAADSNNAAAAIRQNVPPGQQARISGNRYVVEWVTFGEGADAFEQPALCSDGECLETPGGVLPTSKPAATEETHKQFGSMHDLLAADFAEAGKKRATWARAAETIRQRLCEGGEKGDLGEGNMVVLGGNEYSIEVIKFQDQAGAWTGRRTLMMNGASVENLPEFVEDGVRYASGSDMSVFAIDQDHLLVAAAEFIDLRNAVWQRAPATRSGLEPGDSADIGGTTYAFDWVEWREADGSAAHGLVLCADGHPLERLPGRALEKQNRGEDLLTLRRFQHFSNDIDRVFNELREARHELSRAVEKVMPDLGAGDVVQWGTGPGTRPLHVEMLPWNNGYRTGEKLTLCWGEYALNPGPGILVAEGYKRPSLDIAQGIKKAMRNLEDTLYAAPAVRGRRQQRLAAQWAQQQQQWGTMGPGGGGGGGGPKPGGKGFGLGRRILGGLRGDGAGPAPYAPDAGGQPAAAPEPPAQPVQQQPAPPAQPVQQQPAPPVTPPPAPVAPPPADTQQETSPGAPEAAVPVSVGTDAAPRAATAGQAPPVEAPDPAQARGYRLPTELPARGAQPRSGPQQRGGWGGTLGS